MVIMDHSDNALSADNQQERLAYWIVGFVDGEGTFSVSLNRNTTTLSGYQVFPEFVVTQGAKSLVALKLIQEYFGCGNIYENRRYDNHKESLYRYVVRSLHDLRTIIVPFFVRNQLRTAKQKDFLKFCQILELMYERKHLQPDGLESIRMLTQQMNRKARILNDYTLDSTTVEKI
jgi:hypothetical protein